MHYLFAILLQSLIIKVYQVLSVLNLTWLLLLDHLNISLGNLSVGIRLDVAKDRRCLSFLYSFLLLLLWLADCWWLPLFNILNKFLNLRCRIWVCSSLYKVLLELLWFLNLLIGKEKLEEVFESSLSCIQEIFCHVSKSFLRWEIGKTVQGSDV